VYGHTARSLIGNVRDSSNCREAFRNDLFTATKRWITARAIVCELIDILPINLGTPECDRHVRCIPCDRANAEHCASGKSSSTVSDRCLDSWLPLLSACQIASQLLQNQSPASPLPSASGAAVRRRQDTFEFTGACRDADVHACDNYHSSNSWSRLVDKTVKSSAIQERHQRDTKCS
jgi:hypothetical protein